MHFAGRTSENRAFLGETIATRLRGCEVREGPGSRGVVGGGVVQMSIPGLCSLRQSLAWRHPCEGGQMRNFTITPPYSHVGIK